MLRRKNALTLIELLISLALMALLLSTLFFWYHNLTKKKGELEKLKRPFLEERYMCQRLEQILPKAKTPIWGDETSLAFRFDRGISADPLLSETVLGKLYYDERLGALCLGIWPSPEGGVAILEPMLNLTLLDRITKLKFKYYSPPDPFKKTVDPNEIGTPRPIDGWQNAWSYDQLPAFVRLKLTHEGKKRSLYFDLNRPMIYPLENG